MAARIVEYDLGTKGATKRKMKEMQTMAPDKWRKMMTRYWTRVEENCKIAITEMGAVDTGALRDSIRTESGKTIAPGLYSTGNYEVGRTDGDVSAYILAGGGGYINYRHKKEVDYAQAVHDGHFETGKQRRAFIKVKKQRKEMGMPRLEKVDLTRGAGWIAGRPFLDEGIQKTEGYIEQLLKDYMDDKENVWKDDQPIANPYSISTIIKKSKYG